MKYYKGGFTLVELLVVVSIIGILATLTAVNLTEVKKKARDTRRKSEVQQIFKLFEYYFVQNGTYPPCNIHTVFPGYTGADACSSDLGDLWIPGLIPEYVDEIPLDPINDYSGGDAFFYFYTADPNYIQSFYSGPPSKGYPEYIFLYNLETEAGANDCETDYFLGDWAAHCVFL